MSNNEAFEKAKLDLWYSNNELAVEFLERAAIIEFDGGLTREDAERYAYHLVVEGHGKS